MATRRRLRRVRKKAGPYIPSVVEALAFLAGASKMVGGSATSSFMQFDIRSGVTHTINHVQKVPFDVVVGTGIALTPTLIKKAIGIKSKKLIGPIKLI